MTLAFAIMGCCGQNKAPLEFGTGDIQVRIEEGKNWLHDFPICWFIKKKNPPQIAIWTTDMDGNFLSTIYVSEKLAKQSWIAAGGNRRKESLPCWSHAQGKQYRDGLYLPTKEEPLPDAVTGATPKGSFSANIDIHEQVKEFVINFEFNHSVDFNEYYSKDAGKGALNYSGGKMGSGQPAVIYRTVVDLTSGQKEFEAKLIGHSSPDGSDGDVYVDMSYFTTALDIVESITIYVKE